MTLLGHTSRVTVRVILVGLDEFLLAILLRHPNRQTISDQSTKDYALDKDKGKEKLGA